MKKLKVKQLYYEYYLKDISSTKKELEEDIKVLERTVNNRINSLSRFKVGDNYYLRGKTYSLEKVKNFRVLENIDFSSPLYEQWETVRKEAKKLHLKKQRLESMNSSTLEPDEHYFIVKEFHKNLRELLLKGNAFKLPFSLGYLGIVWKTRKRRKAINWNASMILKKELLAQGKTLYSKDNPDGEKWQIYFPKIAFYLVWSTGSITNKEWLKGLEFKIVRGSQCMASPVQNLYHQENSTVIFPEWKD